MWSSSFGGCTGTSGFLGADFLRPPPRRLPTTQCFRIHVRDVHEASVQANTCSGRFVADKRIFGVKTSVFNQGPLVFADDFASPAFGPIL